MLRYVRSHTTKWQLRIAAFSSAATLALMIAQIITRGHL